MRRATACVLLLAMALLAGCGGSDSSREDAAAAAARARAKAARHVREVALGRQVFGEHCASCHTIEGRKARPTYIESPIPNLDEVELRREYVHDRVDLGGFDMASFTSELSPADFEAVVSYVTEAAGSRVTAPDASAEQLALGERIFGETCNRCHGIDGRSMTGRPTFPGTDFNRAKPSVAFVMRQALSGVQEAMPSYRSRLTRAELEAVAAYVTTTAGE
ncbi:MAG TPA: c-type cytochrome [Conexibacter sp.]